MVWSTLPGRRCLLPAARRVPYSLPSPLVRGSPHRGWLGVMVRGQAMRDRRRGPESSQGSVSCSASSVVVLDGTRRRGRYVRKGLPERRQWRGGTSRHTPPLRQNRHRADLAVMPEVDRPGTSRAGEPGHPSTPPRMHKKQRVARQARFGLGFFPAGSAAGQREVAPDGCPG